MLDISGVGLAAGKQVYFDLPKSFAVGHPKSTYRPPLLEAAMRSLRCVRAEARDNQYEEPSEAAISNAKQLVSDLFARVPRQYEVYAGPGGDVAIETEGNKDSVLVVCEQSGSVLVMIYLSGAHKDTKYASIEKLPTEALISAIQAIA